MNPSFQTSICVCPDVNASTMAIDVNGRYAILTGRKGMVLVDLEVDNTECSIDPTQQHHVRGIRLGETNSSTPTKNIALVKRLPKNSKYEPTASHFNRHMVDLFALTTYQVVEVFSIDDLCPMKPKLALRGHSRVITDVEWSNSDPCLLGSSAADCLTNLWDIRDGRRPSATLTSVSGATQVRFSKTSSNLIATSHEIDVRIWDIRQPNLPLYYIAAHIQKINGMDWSPNKTNSDHDQLITCSQDNTIKLWDLNANKIKPCASFSTRTPAWRIRYTPISSDAIATSTLPQLRSRSECMSLRFWSMKPSRYENKKLEFILGLVGHNDVIVDFDWRARPSGTDCELVSWSKDRTLRVWRVDHRFIESNLYNSDYEGESEPAEANCDSIESMADPLGIKISSLEGAELSSVRHSDKTVDEGEPHGRKRHTKTSQNLKDDPITISAQRDHSVPFPSTSGARFCGNVLVCFGRPLISSSTKQTYGGKGGANWLVETPRSMAQLSAQLDNMRRQGSYNLTTVSISYFYYGAMRRNKSLLQTQSYKCGPVIIYDVSSILGGLSEELAENYVFDKDVIRMCRKNAEVAAAHNRRDLVQVWSLAELSSEGVLNSYKSRKDHGSSKQTLSSHNSDFGDRPWTMHPFGSKLIQSLIDHYVYNCHDVQTAAMLVWTFSSPKLGRSAVEPKLRVFHENIEDSEFVPKFNILSPERSLQNDLIMHIYAEMLYRLNLLNQRAMVLKDIGANSAYSELFGYRQEPGNESLSNLINQCYDGSCRKPCRSAQCPSCKKFSLYCSICRLPVRGCCSICLKCLHGGHVSHFDAWFEAFDFCPTGCGCKCLFNESP